MQATRSSCLVKSPYALVEASDNELLDLVRNGHLPATNVLMDRYRSYVLRLVKQRAEQGQVEDITQDILLKIFVNIKKFEQRSLLTTWIYRITLNHLFHHKASLPHVDQAGRHELTMPAESTSNEHCEERKSRIFLGMTLCMDAEQRLAITLADIFKLDHNAAGQIMKVTPVNFRKRLSRARRELKNFTANQCSLMHNEGSCKCKFKTKAFIKKGWIGKNTNTFIEKHIEAARELVISCDNKDA